jgi:hypothetical protein
MSLLEKLKDKINYKVFKALDDPEAATFAAEKAQQQSEENAAQKKQEKQQEVKEQRQKELSEAEANKPPTTFESIFGGFWKVLVFGTFGFLVMVSGSMAANTGIHRHPLIRILYFIFGSVVGLITLIFILPFPPLLIILTIVYILMRWLKLLPHDYSFLPLMQYDPSNNIFYDALQKYVIAWDPLDEKNKNHYLNKVKDYMDILNSSVAAAAKPSVKEESK